MNIELIKAILHVLDPAVDAPILSEAILPPSEDALQYLAGHAAKCFASDEAKACTLADDSAFLPLLWNIEDDFEKKTAVIAGDWFRVMQENPAIPAGDAAFLLLEIDGAEYLAALKLNYKPGCLHYCRMDGGPAVNEVVRQGTVLPGTSGKADEAFFVDLRTNAVRLLEKKYEIDGRKQTYLGSRILGCRAGLSPREKLSAIQAVAGEVNQQFYGNTGVDEPELAMAVCEEFYAARAEEKSRAGKPDPVPVQAICDKLYGDMPHAREAFTKALAEHDITLDEPLPLSAPAVRRMEKQSLRSAGGVEIKVPVNVYRDESALEFIRNPDGSMSLLIKNIIV